MHMSCLVEAELGVPWDARGEPDGPTQCDARHCRAAETPAADARGEATAAPADVTELGVPVDELARDGVGNAEEVLHPVTLT